MRIHFERVGGFAGIRLKADVDTDALSQEEAKSVETLVKELQRGEGGKRSRAKSKTRDAFEYWLTVEDEGKKYSVRMTDETIPAVVQPLVARLLVIAKTPKLSSEH